MPEPSEHAATKIGVRSGVADRRWLRTDRILLIAGLGVLVWLTADVLLLVFAALLLAVGLDGLARGLADRTPVNRGSALALVVVLLLGALSVIGYVIVPRFLEQLGTLWQTLAAAFEWLQTRLDDAGWLEPIADLQNDEGQSQMASAAGTVASHLASITTGALGAIASLIVLLTIALFAAADPLLYRRGLLALVPVPRPSASTKRWAQSRTGCAGGSSVSSSRC